jgi:cell division protease FtsH
VSSDDKKSQERLIDRLRSSFIRRTPQKKKDGLPPKARFSIWYFLAAILLFMYLQQYFFSSKVETIPYSQFKQGLAQGLVSRVTIGPESISGTLKGKENKPAQQFATVRVDDPGLVKELDERKIDYSGHYDSKLLGSILTWVLPLGIMFLIWRFAMKRMGPGQGVMSFAKSKARLFAESETKVTFADVAGIDEAKEELLEVVEFLKTPDKFQKLGGRIPKGVLLVGPPGTGKTLLAKAVAGEAKVPFFSISGSEFVEMFVGVGASRVRDLFSQATGQAPCIIFIDELDALGKARGMNVFGGNDEREQTLNQLLVEMDGFESNKGVIIMAATNRPEILDPALLRPGRFDRQVLVDRPDINGRETILKIHSRNVLLGSAVGLRKIASLTPGFVGSDLANLVNEAALLAARKNKETVGSAEFDEAIDRVVGGLEKKNRVMNAQEKEIVAFHESGHAIVAESVEHADSVHKISIIPRGIAALGYTQQQPTEDRYLLTRLELVAFESPRQPMFPPEGYSPNKTYSETKATQIDDEISIVMERAHQRVRDILSERRQVLDHLARLLSEKEIVQGQELRDMLAASAPVKGTGVKNEWQG